MIGVFAMNDIQKVVELIGQANKVEDIDILSLIENFNNSDETEKCDIISALSKFSNVRKIQQLAIRMINDESALVRCEAYELLEQSENYDIMPLIVEKLHAEKKSIVRLYILIAIYWIIVDSGIYDNNLFASIYSCYQKERTIRAEIGFCAVLYLWKHETTYIDVLMKYVNNRDYHIRCTAINTLSDMYLSSLDNPHKEKVKKCFGDRMKIEKSAAVTNLISSIMKDIG